MNEIVVTPSVVAVLLLALEAETRTYHTVAIAKLAQTTWTHVKVCGQVTLVKHERDGDGHMRISDGKAFIVAEVIPYHPIKLPKVGSFVWVGGISRFDKYHGWAEIHPVEYMEVVPSCQ